jgi:hypothetical protein
MLYRKIGMRGIVRSMNIDKLRIYAERIHHPGHGITIWRCKPYHTTGI